MARVLFDTDFTAFSDQRLESGKVSRRSLRMIEGWVGSTFLGKNEGTSSMYFLAWIIIGLIIGSGWLTGELLRGGGFGPIIGSGS
jgi:hypothetical protein